jgi:anti-sigma B factor antagonist
LEDRNGTPIVRVRGEIDMTSAADFRSAIANTIERTKGRIVVALDECTYFDSTAVGILVGTQKKIPGRLVVVVPEHGVVRKIIDISGLGRIVTVAHSIDEAVTEI